MNLKSLSVILTTFVVFSCVLLKVGNPENPLVEKITQTAHLEFDYIILGDSRSNAAIAPRVMDSYFQKTGLSLKGHNFSSNGSDVLHHRSFIFNLLGKLKTKPKFIIWTPNPLHFDSSRKTNRLNQLYFSDLLNLTAHFAPVEQQLDLFTMLVFPPWRHKPMMANLVSDYMARAGIRLSKVENKVLHLILEKDPESRIYLNFDDGQEPFRVLSWKDRFDRGAEAYQHDYAKLKLGEIRFKIVEDMVKELQKNEIKLIILELPVAPWYLKNLSTLKNHKVWESKISEMANKLGVPYINHSNFLFTLDTDFGDPGHMHLDSSLKYSEKLAQVIKEVIQ